MAMEGHNIGRFISILISVAIFVVVIVLNSLAGRGLSPFQTSIGNVSKKYETEITPSDWTFSIWIVIYIWLTLMICYILTTLCIRNAYGYKYSSPAVLPYGFFLTWILNMICNITWISVWDKEQTITSLVFIALMSLTNYGAIFFACHGVTIYGSWLNKYHKRDLGLLYGLVENGIATYATWTTLATLVNLAVVMEYNGEVSKEDSGTVCYSLLLVIMVFWFILENTVLDRFVRYILTIYPVVIVALAGNMTKNYDPISPNRNGIFIAVLLGLATLLLVLRLLLVARRHITRPLFKTMTISEAQTPIQIAGKQNILFT